MVQYLLTISCQQKLLPIYKADLLCVRRTLPLTAIFADSYETSGKYNQLHYHALVEFKGYWKLYTQYIAECYKTYRIHWKKVRDFYGAMDYVYKDTHNCPIKQDMIFICNYAKHNYITQ